MSLTIMYKIIRFICYWNRKIVVGKNRVFCEGPASTATIIISEVTFEEFLEKLYKVIAFDKLYTCLAVTVDIR